LRLLQLCGWFRRRRGPRKGDLRVGKANFRRGAHEKAPPPRRLPALPYIGLGGFVLVLAGLALAVLSWRPVPAKALSSPRLELDRAQIDLGQVKVGTMVSAVFTLTNGGEKPLQIIGEPQVELRTGC
jgi:hypothetical protein